MPSVTIYGNDLSPPARAARMVAAAIGLDVDLKRTYPLRGQCRTPEYLKINPMHQIPTLNDNGFHLSDSHAIVSYLADKYGKNDSLYPKDLAKRAIVNERLCFDMALYTRVLQFVAPTLLFKKPSPPEAAENLTDSLDTLERYLSSNKFVAGDSLSIADYCCYVSTRFIEVIDNNPLDLKKYKNIERWFELLLKTDVQFKKDVEITKKAVQTYDQNGNY